MNTILKFGEQFIKDTDLIPLLSRYRMLPQLLRELIIDQEISPITYNNDDIATAQQQFCIQHEIKSYVQLQTWLAQHNMTQNEFEEMIIRSFCIEKFKKLKWEHTLEHYFLCRKQDLDQAIFSILQTDDVEVAHELHYRIQKGERTFAELAREYSQGAEAKTGGLVGPVELSQLPRSLVQAIYGRYPGELLTPMPLGQWSAIIRLEATISARLDEPMRQRLLTELFEKWIQDQLAQYSRSNGGLHLSVASVA